MGVTNESISSTRRQGKVRLGAYFAFTVSGEVSSLRATTSQTTLTKKGKINYENSKLESSTRQKIG